MKKTGDNNFLGEEKLGKLMIKYTAPCVVSMLMGGLYNIIDQIFIANASYLGSYGNAANTVVFPMTVIAMAIAVMIGNGACAFISICLGAKKSREAGAAVGNAIISVVAVGFVLMFVYLLLCDPIINLFGASVNDKTFELSHEYFFWISLGIPLFMFGQALNPIIRADGSQSFAMAMITVGVALNIILDPIFIYIFHWGMMGAALATDIGQLVSAVMAYIYLFRMKAIPLSRRCFIFRRRLVKRFLQLGVSDFFAQFCIVLSMAATIRMSVKYGALDPVFGRTEYSQIPTAIAGIVSKFYQIIISISIGLAAGCTPIVGYNYGAMLYKRVLGIMKRLLAAEALCGLAATLIFLIFPNQLILIFGASNEGIYYTDFAVWFIRCQLCLLPLACVNKSCFIFLQALGKPKEASALSVMREFVLAVGFTVLLPMIWGLYAIPFFMPAADTVTFIAAAFVLIRVVKVLKNDMKAA